MQVEDSGGCLNEGVLDLAQDKLDAFREAVLPSENYGITLSRTRGDELSDPDLLSNGVSWR